MVRRFLAILCIVCGLFLVGSVVVPIGFAALCLSFAPTTLIDPTATSGPPRPVILDILGLPTTDYTWASTWFAAGSQNPPVVSNIKYFSLNIPRLKMADVTVEVNGANLKRNAIHYPGSSLPGTAGNVVVFGHSSLPQFYQSGKPLTIFNPLIKANIGDDIYISFDGVDYHYVVRQTLEVLPSRVEVLNQRYDKNELTLITCVPLGTYWRRFVVVAELVN